MAQKHSQLNPQSPCFRFEPSKHHPTGPSQESKNPCNSNGNRQQHKKRTPSPPRKNNNRQRNRLQHNNKNRKAQKNGPLSPVVTKSKKSRPRQENTSRKGHPKTNSPQNIVRKSASIEEPEVNDVVCISIPHPKRPRGVVAIQPHCKHEGNLLFGAIVWNTAHRYRKAIGSLSKNPTLSNCLDATKEKMQKKLAGIIAAKIIARGGRFLVWIKQDESQTHYSNNGSWQFVGREDILNISRYALLRRVKDMEDTEKDKRNEKDVAVKLKAHESDESTATTIDTSTYSNESILRILSEFDLDSDEEDLDYWLTCPTTDTTDRRMPSEVRCWDYKLLLPMQVA